MSEIRINIPDNQDLKFNKEKNCYELVNKNIITITDVYEYLRVESKAEKLRNILDRRSFIYWQLQMIAKFYNNGIDVDPFYKKILYRLYATINSKKEIRFYLTNTSYKDQLKSVTELPSCYLHKETLIESVKCFSHIWEEYVLCNLSPAY